MVSRPPPYRRLRLYTEDEADALCLSASPAETFRALREIAPQHGRSFPLPACPTTCAPGTPDKLRVLIDRHARREQLWHPADGRMDDRQVISSVGRARLLSFTEVDQDYLEDEIDRLEAEIEELESLRFDAVARSWLVPGSAEFIARKAA